jgi:hypothetical protein
MDHHIVAPGEVRAHRLGGELSGCAEVREPRGALRGLVVEGLVRRDAEVLETEVRGNPREARDGGQHE